MASMMTRGEAEKLLNLTEDYTFADLKAKYKKHMVKFHPDKFPDEPADGKMGKAEAEKEFVRGTHAFDALEPLFKGMPSDHKETPEANWRTHSSHANATGNGNDYDPTGHAEASESSATTNAYTNGYAGYAETNAATGSETAGTSARTTWDDFHAERTKSTKGTDTTSNGAPSDWAAHQNSRRASSRSARDRSRESHQRPTTTYATYTTAQASNVGTSVTDGSSVDTTHYGTVHGGPLFWCIIVLGVIALVFWNRADPKTAFVTVVQFIFNPGKMLFLLTGLGFVYVKGW